MTSLRAVLLDVGNTLVHEEPSRFALYARAANARGIEIEERAMRSLMVKAHHALPAEVNGGYRYSDPWFAAYIERIFVGELGLAAAECPTITRELFDVFEHPDTFRLYPGALELLDDLRDAGLTLGVVSNWSARLPRVLEVLDVARRFDFVLCSAIERMEKPEARIFEAALERAGCSADQALHAGDHPEKDVQGAQACGLHAVLVDHADVLGDAGADCPRVGDLAQLRSLILEHP